MSHTSLIEEFSNETGRSWENIFKAQKKTSDNICKIKSLFPESPFSSDLDFVVYGSFARKECTDESDVDWTLLIDGQADVTHLRTAQNIKSKIKEAEFPDPGGTGMFGRTTISHEMIHNIGGQDDTNHNITKRMLLLLESRKLSLSANEGNGTAYERVIRGVISQYVTHDSGLYSGRSAIPRFLLNDIVRFWRTMCVDFAYKQKEQGDYRWALRNIKLRISRKLLFVKGLFMTLSNYSKEHKTHTDDLKNSLEGMVFMTPFEVLLDVRKRKIFSISKENLIILFDCYDTFLGILNNPDKRGKLESMKMHEINSMDVFLECREIGDKFQEALTSIFLEDDKDLKLLTIKYGVF